MTARKRLTGLLLLLSALLPMRAHASAAGDFAVANRAFSEGDFAAALRAYERSLADQLHPNAFLNLGNTCFRLGRSGPAALCYERALALQPRHPDAAANLKLVREKSGAHLLDEPWWERALLWLAPATVMASALGAAWFFTLLGVILAAKKKRAGAAGCTLGLVAMAGWASATYWEYGRRAQIAIVTGERTSAHTEQSERAPVASALPPGSQVRVLGSHAGWSYCLLPGGQRGWVHSASLGFILPGKNADGSPQPLPSLATAAAVPPTPAFTDWREALTRSPGSAAELRPANFHYAFGWSGITAAEADVEFSQPSAQECALVFSAKTTGLVRSMWKLDAAAQSACDRTTFRPAKLTQKEIYSDYKVTTVVDFLADGPERLRSVEPPEPGSPWAAKFQFPGAYDVASALLFIRSQPLAQGDTVRLCVYPGSAPYLATATVTGRGTLKAVGREWKTIVCDLQLSRIGEDFSLTPHKKFRKATAWLSDDSDRVLLKAEAEIMVGTIWCELRRISFPEK